MVEFRQRPQSPAVSTVKPPPTRVTYYYRIPGMYVSDNIITYTTAAVHGFTTQQQYLLPAHVYIHYNDNQVLDCWRSIDWSIVSQASCCMLRMVRFRERLLYELIFLKTLDN